MAPTPAFIIVGTTDVRNVGALLVLAEITLRSLRGLQLSSALWRAAFSGVLMVTDFSKYVRVVSFNRISYRLHLVDGRAQMNQRVIQTRYRPVT